MMRPRTSILVAGHPVVAVPVTLLHAGLGWAYTCQYGFGWPTLYCIAFVGWIGNCYQTAKRYRDWQREWDSFRSQPPSKAQRLPAIAGLIGIALVVGLVWLGLHYNDPDSAAHTIAPLVALVVPVAALAFLLLRRRKRRATPSNPIVTQAARPVPAPSVAAAYARLPEYCRPLLTPTPARKEQT